MVFIVAVGATLIALDLATSFLVNWNWFSSVGYLGVYWTIILAKIGLFFATFVTSGITIWVNGIVAHRNSGRRANFRVVNPPWSSLQGISQPPLLERLYRHFPWRALVAALAIILAALIAVSEVGNWNLVLRFLYQVSYGKTDPLFGNDFSFYLFSLPALIAFKNWLLSILVLSALCAAGIYWAHGEIVLDNQPVSYTHLTLPTIYSV